MKDLSELVSLFQKSKFKASGLVKVILEPGSQMERLYEGIANKVVATDEQAIDQFPEWKGNKARYASLKSKLHDRLFDAALLLDFNEPAYADRKKAFHECSRKHSSALILLGKDVRKIGIDLLETVLRNTLRFEFTELSLDILRSLSMHYTFIEGESKKYDELEGLLSAQEEIWHAERQMERIYKDLINSFVRRKSSNKQMISKAKSYLDLTKTSLAKYETYNVQLFGRLTEIVYYDSIGDHRSIVRLAEAGLTYFTHKPYTSTTALQAMYYHLIIALLNLRQYDRCKAISEEYQDMFEPGLYNWFKLQEALFLSATHSGHYQEARSICEMVMGHAKYDSQPAPIWELWKIFEAFIAYLVGTGVLDKGGFPTHFRLLKFHNDIQVFARDKGGMNIPVQVIQFMHYLVEYKYEECLERVEALTKYRVRYLAEASTFRSHFFIRMLEQIPKAGFDAQKVALKTQALLKNLQSLPLGIADQNHEIEIIPYEALWEMIMNRLSKKKQPIPTKSFSFNQLNIEKIVIRNK